MIWNLPWKKKRFLESVIERKQICIENKKPQKQENWIKHDLDVKQVKDLTLEFSVDDENKQKKKDKSEKIFHPQKTKTF